MKSRFLFGLIALFAFATNLWAGPRGAQWSKVDDAVRQGLPKSAIAELDPIIEGAMADKAYAKAIKAIIKKIVLEGQIQGDKPEEKIVRLQAQLAKAPAAMQPAMEAILAHWYWRYFQQNRGRFLQRTQTAAAPGPDILTWDLARILAEIDRHFVGALAAEATLQATPIADYNDLLETGTVPDIYRPTLFDFLVYEALSFYQTGEQAVMVAEDEFEFDAASPIFGDVDEFMRWQPAAANDASPALKAVRLYQRLLRFHQANPYRFAFFDADLARLTYGHNKAVGEDKDTRYQAALRRFIEATAKHEISARALALLATQINQAGDPAQAHALAQRGFDAFPQSPGGAQCYNLIQNIERKTMELYTERVWNAPWPTLDVLYQNITQIHFRAVAVDANDYEAQRRWSYGGIDAKQRQALLAATPVLEWSADLPPTKDFKLRLEQLPAPAALKPGFYCILASPNRAFGDWENIVSGALIWVSDIALVTQSRAHNKPISGLVLSATSGAPISGATVRLWQRDRTAMFRSLAPQTSDADGRFYFAKADDEYFLQAEHSSQAVTSSRALPNWGDQRANADSRTIFFTDRALYRPGQMIHYKGICLRTQPRQDDYQTIAGEEVEVLFQDSNGKEIARDKHTTNDYGSFSGTFTAPRDRLMGRMKLLVQGKVAGSTTINVEEYKRPKFQVELTAPVEETTLAAPVQLTGKATAYTGAAIGGAKVKWRVQRGVQCPYWCWWWRPAAPKAIAHGTTVTEPDGTFKIQFIAEPDRSVPVKNEPTFAFVVYADVSDTTGETRSSERTVRVGYVALQTALTVAEWQTTEKPVEVTVETKSLEGEPRSASGTVIIYALQQPVKVQRAEWQGRSDRVGIGLTGGTPTPRDPANPESWELDREVASYTFTTDATGRTSIAASLPAGIYRAVVAMKDRYGQPVTARRTVQVVDPRASHYGVKLPNHFVAPKWSVEPGETFTALWGTGYDRGRAFVELECGGKLLKSYWTKEGRTQELIELPITENMRGGLTLRVTYVRENRAYLNERTVDVPWSNKRLAVKWESFRSKLLPGQKETWTAVVTGPDAQRTAAEMIATLYDASLDQFRPHRWPQALGGFRRESSDAYLKFQNAYIDLEHLVGSWTTQTRGVDWHYRAFQPEIVYLPSRIRDVVVLESFSVRGATPTAGAMMALSTSGEILPKRAGNNIISMQQLDREAPPYPLDLSKVTARKNLHETAFFFPHLTAGDDGVVRMTFTMPEALTEWKFLGFAHDNELRSGLLTDKVVTAKDLMVEPNPPRFVREGDVIEFTVKVSNQTDRPQTGQVRLNFADAATLQSADAALGNRAPEQAFDVPAKQSRSYAWRIAVPDDMGFLTYKAVGATAQSSDGEEGYLPVLSRRTLVTESLPLPIRGQQTKPFTFQKLLNSGASDTLRHQSLTVQMVSQPAWYAVMALPYLMEFPHECSEQLFSRFYANALARHIANSDPKIRRVFDLWKGTPALDSPLEKNQDLKSVLIEETPWLRQASKESQSRRNVGLLFDSNRLDEAMARALRKLTEQQLGEGLWPWFPGGRPSEYISLYIVTGFGRLRHLGVANDVTPAVKALSALDAWMEKNYLEILRRPEPEKYIPGSIDALYLYGRSFFLKDQPIAQKHREAVDFFLRQSRKYWLEAGNRQSQAHLALALQRFGDAATPAAIMKSLKERSVSDAELGMFWRDQERSWWWYHAPIETQSVMIEAFAEVARDEQAVEDCKVWLLKQKQTQSWKTTKATADAIYGLLLRGSNLLASDALVEVALGGQAIKPEKVEAGTGFYERKFVRDEIKPAQGQIVVKKTDAGVSWGSIHWQYLEDVAKLTPHEGTPLKLKKALFVKETTGKGQVLKPVTGPLSVGDELVVRLELRTDRDMEFVHLKDQRGSGTEPVNVLSRYKYQDGLAYYESTRDTASHFFIDYLPKGTYVFEYATRVQLRGRYQSGMAEIQCMYAPEFNSHSESFALEVK